MIGYLEGTWRNGVVVTGGVGYRVTTPVEPTDGAHVELWVTTVVRDNDISLYGFPDAADQQLFEALTAVPRVGPQMAMALLRDVGAPAVAGAVASKDPVALTKAKGVGRKAADLIVSTVSIPDCIVAEAASPGGELVLALADMGFDETAAADAVREVLAESPGADEATVLAEALTLLVEKK